MNSKLVQALKKASTPLAFRVALKALPLQQKYFTNEIADIIVRNKNLVTTSEAADSATKFFYNFSRLESNRIHLKNDAFCDFVNFISDKITSGSMFEFGSILCNLTFEDEENAELYATSETLKSILACFHRVTTAEGAQWMASALNNILKYDPSANKILNSLPIVKGFNALVPYATTSEAAEWTIKALDKFLRDNEAGRKLFTSKAWIDHLTKLKSIVPKDETNLRAQKMIDLLRPRKTFIKFLQNASSSTEFKRLVDEIPRDESFYSEEIRDIILNKKNLIQGSPTADAVTDFFMDFSGYDESRPFLNTPEIRDLIINVLAPHVSSDEGISNLGTLIGDIASEDEAAAELFPTPKSFIAILSCFHRVTTSDGAHWMASALTNILASAPSASNKLLNNLPVREAFESLVPHVTTDDAAEWTISALWLFFKENADGQKLFRSDDEWINNLIKLKDIASQEAAKLKAQRMMHVLRPRELFVPSLQNASSSTEFKRLVDEIPRDQSFYCEEIRDIILNKKNLIEDSPTADAVIFYLKKFSDPRENRPLLRTPAIHDLIINILAPQVNSAEGIFHLGHLIADIASENKSAAKLFATPEFLAAILSCFHRVSASSGARWMAAALHRILNNAPGSNKILNDLPIREAFDALAPHATYDDAATWTINALNLFLKNNEDGQKLFRSEVWINNLIKLKDDASEEEEDENLIAQRIMHLLRPKEALVESLQRVSSSTEFKRLVDEIPRDQSFFCEEIRDIILNKNLIEDASSAEAVTDFLNDFSRASENRPPLCTPEIRDLIINILAPHVSSDEGISNLGTLIGEIASENEAAAELFASAESFTAILSCFHRVTTPEGADWMASALNNILNDAPVSNKLLNDLPIREGFEALMAHATSENAAKWTINALWLFFKDNEVGTKLFAAKKEWIENIEQMKALITSEEALENAEEVKKKLLHLQENEELVDSDPEKTVHGQNQVPEKVDETDNLNTKTLEEYKQELEETKEINQRYEMAIEDMMQLNSTQENKIKTLEEENSQLKKEMEAMKRQDTESITSLHEQILHLQNKLDSISPFVNNKPYQINYSVNNVPEPSNFHLAPQLHEASTNSLIYDRVLKMIKTGGGFDSRYEIVGLDVVVRPDVHVFEAMIARLQRRQKHDHDEPAAYSQSQQEVLDVLEKCFLPYSSSSSPAVKLVNVFHATSVEVSSHNIEDLVVRTKTADQNFFCGSGVHATPNCAAAATQARDSYNSTSSIPKKYRGCVPVVWSVAAVGHCFVPVNEDQQSVAGRTTDCFAKIVSSSSSSASKSENLELVFEQEFQVLPMGILWVKVA